MEEDFDFTPEDAKPSADVVFEVSWEVCNKVGGINTVIVSKAQEMMRIYDGGYYAVGPYKPDQFKGEFHEIMPDGAMMVAFSDLLREGIRCHFGKWLIKGEPFAILIDFSDFISRKDQIKTELWNAFNIDSLNSPWDYDEVMIWSYAAGKVVERIAQLFSGKKLLMHCHEWLASGALLYLKMREHKDIATVFTTHATVLGRSLANGGINFYDNFDRIDVRKSIYAQGVQAKALTEAAAAQHADAFTTVSAITNEEATHFLQREADVLLPNGLEIGKFPNLEQISLNHKVKRNRLRSFLLYYFTPYYQIDVENTLFYFLASRYEFENKGIDVFIEALGKLNDRLKSVPHAKTIVAFLFVPSNVKGIDLNVINNREIFREVETEVDDSIEDIKNQLMYYAFSKQDISKEKVFSDGLAEDIQHKVGAMNAAGSTPPPVTHILNYTDDAVLKAIAQAGLRNTAQDNVKIIFYPTYLQAADGILNMDYYDVLAGSHLGVFPSFYEPWGYTPLETAALGVGTVTTDLTGFGRYIQKYILSTNKYPGIFLLRRARRAREMIVNDLADMLFQFAQYATRERIENKMQARKLAALADWKFLIRHYVEAHNFALKKIGK